MDNYQIDDIINQLSGNQPLTVERYESLIQQICPVAVKIFSKEPSLLQLQAPIWITGDGGNPDFKTIFRCPEFKYLYMGNYGGHPNRSNHLDHLSNYLDQYGNCLPTILLLLAIKIKHPKNIFLVKGNLNAWTPYPPCVDEIDGEMEMPKISSNSERILYDCFNSLPVAALINDKIICTQGGLSPILHNLDQIRQIKRTDLPSSPLFLELLGPHSPNVHNLVGDNFVAKELQFLEKHDLRLICRDRYQAESKKNFVEDRVVSTSSSSYKGAKVIILIRVDANLKCSLYDSRNERWLTWSYQIRMPASIQKESSSGAKHGEEPSLRKLFPFYGKPAQRMSKSNTGSTNVATAKPESSQEGRPFEFDPATLYRSKSPGVKRFIGARV